MAGGEFVPSFEGHCSVIDLEEEPDVFLFYKNPGPAGQSERCSEQGGAAIWVRADGQTLRQTRR